MEQTNETGGNARTGIATNLIEAIVAFILLVIGAVVIYSSMRLGSKWTSDGPGSGYFPFYIGLMLCLSGTATMYQALFGKKKNTESFVDRGKFKLVMAVLVPAAVYVLIIQLVGIYLASTLYIALFMSVLGKYSWIKSSWPR